MEGHINKGRILIKEIKPEEKKINGVIVPSSVETQRKGVVVLLGEAVDEALEIGKTVYFVGRRATQVNIDFEDYLLMPDEEILYIE